ncbi:MAG: hypothetical protein J6U20_13375 [Fibrobacter sp.]|nr:hypothetical protein [Fibrobacter sp.]
MRLILISVALFVASAWSAVGVWWANLQFEKGYLNIDTSRVPAVDTLYVNYAPERGFAYYSTLDTNCAVFSEPHVPKIRIYCMFLPDSLYYVMARVMRYEFMNWQSWGVLNMSKDSAQTLIEKIISGDARIINTDIVFKKKCEDNPLTCYFQSGAGGGASGGIPEEDFARLPQKKILAESSVLVQADTSAKDPVGEQPKDSAGVQEGDSANVTTPDSTEKPLFISREAPVNGSLLGLRYSEFDVNGVFIRSGIWQGSLKATGSTRVVRFENGKTAIFR